MSSGAAMTESTCETVGSLVRNIRARLAAAGIESNEQEAIWLIEFALGFSAVTQVIDHDRPLAALRKAGLDAGGGGLGFLRVVDERQAVFFEVDTLKLRQDAVADRLGRNTS